MSIALIAGLAMLVGAVAEVVALYFLLNMLLESGAVRTNYRKRHTGQCRLVFR